MAIVKKYQTVGSQSNGTGFKSRFLLAEKPVNRSSQHAYGSMSQTLIPGVGVSNFSERSTWQEPVWTSLTSVVHHFGPDGPSSSFPYAAEWQGAYNKAYSKFLEKVYDRASMATNLAERAETMAMLCRRLSQAVRFIKAFKRKDPKGMSRALGQDFRGRGVRSRARTASALWLEYWFGWAPLVNDIYNCVANFADPIPNIPIKAGCSRPFSRSSKQTYSGDLVTGSWTGDVRVVLSGCVVVSNPCTFELSRAGLVNPALTAFEVLPFSWFLGWFLNVEQVLSSYTDFVGLQLSNAAVSTRFSGEYSYERYSGGRLYKKWGQREEWYTRAIVTNFPRPYFEWKLPNGLSPTRGATLASLLVQFFVKG